VEEVQEASMMAEKKEEWSVGRMALPHRRGPKSRWELKV